MEKPQGGGQIDLPTVFFALITLNLKFAFLGHRANKLWKPARRLGRKNLFSDKKKSKLSNKDKISVPPLFELKECTY